MNTVLSVASLPTVCHTMACKCPVIYPSSALQRTAFPTVAAGLTRSSQISEPRHVGIM